MWVSQQNVTHKLSDTLFDEAFSGDGYEVSFGRVYSFEEFYTVMYAGINKQIKGGPVCIQAYFQQRFWVCRSSQSRA